MSELSLSISSLARSAARPGVSVKLISRSLHQTGRGYLGTGDGAARYSYRLLLDRPRHRPNPSPHSTGATQVTDRFSHNPPPPRNVSCLYALYMQFYTCWQRDLSSLYSHSEYNKWSCQKSWIAKTNEWHYNTESENRIREHVSISLLTWVVKS